MYWLRCGYPHSQPDAFQVVGVPTLKIVGEKRDSCFRASPCWQCAEHLGSNRLWGNGAATFSTSWISWLCSHPFSFWWTRCWKEEHSWAKFILQDPICKTPAVKPSPAMARLIPHFPANFAQMVQTTSTQLAQNKEHGHGIFFWILIRAFGFHWISIRLTCKSLDKKPACMP